MSLDAPFPFADPALVQAGPPDEELVRRICTGEVALFEILMRRHNQKVYRAIRSLLRDEAEIEDAMQQAYLSAWTHLDRFTGEARFSTWLVRIALNEGLMRLRRARRAQTTGEPPSEEVSMSTPTPHERAESRELAGLLAEAVDGLPELYRTVFVLRQVEELSTAEAAQALQLSEVAVKTRLLRARAMVRRALADRIGQAAPEVFQFGAQRCDRVVAQVMSRIVAS